MDVFKVSILIFGIAFCAAQDVTLTPKDSKSVTVGSSIEMTCTSTADIDMSFNGGSISSYNFKGQERNDAGVTTFKLVHKLSDIKKSDAGDYVCYQKSDPSKKQTFKLYVATITPENGKWGGQAYQSTVLGCKVDDPNKSTLSWKKDGQDLSGEKFNITGNNVVVNKIGKKDIGEYQCIFTFNEKQRGSVTGKVYLESAPLIEKLPESKNLVQDETLNISCKIYGYPVPSVTWFKEGKEISSDKRIQFEESHGVPNATLVIQSLENEDRAEYSCQAINSHGNKTQTFLLRVKGKYAALWPFIGIVIEVLVVCAIIFIYEKKRSRPESDDNGPLDAKANDEKPSADVRQRNVKA